MMIAAVRAGFTFGRRSAIGAKEQMVLRGAILGAHLALGEAGAALTLRGE